MCPAMQTCRPISVPLVETYGVLVILYLRASQANLKPLGSCWEASLHTASGATDRLMLQVTSRLTQCIHLWMRHIGIYCT